MLRTLFVFLMTALFAAAQQAPPSAPAAEAPPETEAAAAAPGPAAADSEPASEAEPEADGSRVTVLGYHDFSETLAETEMRIRTSKFRTQMAALRSAGVTVISMADFLAWKSGGKEIPRESVLITIDDGWRSVYTDAYPVLREFGYPFTLFLYKSYVDGGGKALTSAMIKEMAANGATIGSHSVSHPYPANYKAQKRRGERSFDAFLRKEFGESKRFLEARFGKPVLSFAYPGGYVIPEMAPISAEFGYQALFTVLPGRITRDTDPLRLPRYIILGTHDHIFTLATTFAPAASPADGGPDSPAANGANGAIAAALAPPPPTAHPVFPEPGALIEERLPVIRAELAGVENLDPASLVMEVSGFGSVAAGFDPERKVLSWKATRKLRQPVCNVTVSWKDLNGHAAPVPLRWQFRLDRVGAYLPLTAAAVPAGETTPTPQPAPAAAADGNPPKTPEEAASFHP